LYRIVLDEETETQIEALPYEALVPLAHLLDVLSLDSMERRLPQRRQS